MVSAWKESGKLKDLKIEELNFQLGQAAAQLEVAKQDNAALQQQLADSCTKVCGPYGQPSRLCIACEWTGGLSAGWCKLMGPIRADSCDVLPLQCRTWAHNAE
jgi:hypothetical protein